MGIQGSAERYIPASPDAVFTAVTDVDSLPQWNDRIVGVAKTGELGPGAVWIVEIKILGQTFQSRSEVIDFDAHARRIRFRSKRVDNNPSFTEWTWEVTPEGDGSHVRVSWDLQAKTLLRRRLVAPMRGRQIPEEAAASLEQLERRLR